MQSKQLRAMVLFEEACSRLGASESVIH